MEKSRKIPKRTCCVCGAQGAKKTLVRVVRTPEGTVKVDPTGREAGRGAYLCADESCMQKARKQHRLEKALRIRMDEEDYEKVQGDFEAVIADDASPRKER